MQQQILSEKITVSILFICFIAATFSNSFIVLAYQLNQQYITAAFCQNKANTSLHCNGHCYLSKRLDKEEKPSSALNTKKSEIQLFCSPFPLQFENISADTKMLISQQQIFALQQYLHNHFHPPQA